MTEEKRLARKGGTTQFKRFVLLLAVSFAGYELGGLMNVNTPFGPLDMPFQSAGQTSFRH